MTRMGECEVLLVLSRQYTGKRSLLWTSWAAMWTTTRVEDLAYCLLGLFDVNMSPLYGEGEKAFVRLQREILKISDDESIFAWKDEDSSSLHSGGILASSPRQFLCSGGIKRLGDHEIHAFEVPTQPFSMTNKGLHITLPLWPFEHG